MTWPEFRTTHRPDVVVFEKRPRWTPELKRRFQDGETTVRGCLTVKDLAEKLGRAGRSVAILDLAADPAGCLQFLGRSTGPGKRSPVVVVGSRRTAELEWVVRELGAAAFVRELATGEELARLCRFQWQQSQS